MHLNAMHITVADAPEYLADHGTRRESCGLFSPDPGGDRRCLAGGQMIILHIGCELPGDGLASFPGVGNNGMKRVLSGGNLVSAGHTRTRIEKEPFVAGGSR